MKAQDFDIHSTFTKILGHQPIEFLSIPEYQRNYSWGQDQLEDFWKTMKILIYHFPKTQQEQQEFLGTYYFFGSILIQKHKDSPTHLEIVDGQQRTITFFLLMVVLIICSNTDDEKMNKVQELFFSSAGQSKLFVKNKDQAYFTELLTNENIFTTEGQAAVKQVLDNWEYEQKQQREQNQELEGKIRLNAVFLYQQVKTLNQQELSALIAVIIHKIRYIQIVLESYEDSYSIFDTMNSTGLGVTFPDIVKNLLGRIEPKVFVEWEAYFDLNLDKEMVIFWEQQLPDFFQRYLAETIEENNPDLTLRERERKYREKILIWNTQQVLAELKQILSSANHYATIRDNNTTQMRTDIELNICYN